MREFASRAFSKRPGCWWSMVVGLVLLVPLAGYLICQGLWVRHERADVERLAEEARRLGGDAEIPEGGVDFSQRKVDVFLDLSHGHVGDEEFARLAAMPAFRRLHILDLSGTRITDRSLKLLEKTPTPISLNLSGTGISDEGMESITKLPWLNTLQLAGTAVTDRGIDTLVKQAGSLNLRSMDLTSTKVTEEGLKKLSKAFDFLYIKRAEAQGPTDPKP